MSVSIISKNIIHAPYTLVWISLLLLFLGKSDIASIPTWNPEDLYAFAFIWVILDGPHIVASYFSFVNRDYAKRYAKTLSLAFSLAALGLAALYFLPSLYGYTIFAIATIYHVVKQQVGMAWSIEGKFRFSQLDIGIQVFAGVAVLLYIADTISLQSFEIIRIVLTMAIAIVIIWRFLYSTGKLYFYLSNFVIACIALWSIPEFVWLSILLPRLVHDWCAYAIYIKHDRKQRSSHVADNYIYKWFPVWSTGIITVSLSMGVNILVAKISIALYFFLAFMHYVFEGIIWKKGSLHREMIQSA